MRRVYEDSMSGRAVIDATGRVIGEVVGLVLDLASWHVEAVRVKLHRDVMQALGGSHAIFRAPRLDVPTDFIRDVTDTIVLRDRVETLHLRPLLEAHRGHEAS